MFVLSILSRSSGMIRIPGVDEELAAPMFPSLLTKRTGLFASKTEGAPSKCIVVRFVRLDSASVRLSEQDVRKALHFADRTRVIK